MRLTMKRLVGQDTKPHKNENNIKTNALERSVQNYQGVAGKQIFTLSPEVMLNTKAGKKRDSHKGSLSQSMHHSKNETK